MYDIRRFTQAEANECGAALSRMGLEAESMEEVANRIVRHLYDNLADSQSGQKSCALVRFYKTHPYSELDEGLQAFARGILGSAPASPTLNCLTLLGTVGDKTEWNSRANSAGHKAIPLASEQMIAQIPMVSQLVS